MFQKERLIKNYIFLFLDMTNVVISLMIANIIRYGKLVIFVGEDKDLYILFLAVELFACVLCNRMFNVDKHVLIEDGSRSLSVL